MKHYLISLALSIASLAAAAGAVGIASGQPTGTNYPMVDNIVKVCSTSTSPIRNVVSDGSLDNINKVYADKTVQYGIAQTDALEYMKGQDPKMMDRILMVFPFFSTEMHLVVKDGSPIKSLSQLAGKRVVEGPEGSGTWVSVQVIKALTGLQWTAVAASQKDGFDAVMVGKADAEFIVAGAPVKMLESASGFSLVNLQHQALDKFGLYTKAMINSSTYPSIKKTVSTYKVDNVLVTYAFKSQYQAEIGGLVGCITKNMDRLQSESDFHAKWRDVVPEDLNRIEWPVHPAAKAAVDRYRKFKK